MSSSEIYYMEKDGAVKIPDKYKKMTHGEIVAECARLIKVRKISTKAIADKPKMVVKTKFNI